MSLFYRFPRWLPFLTLLPAILPVAKACGPDFPNSFLSNSVEELSSLPALSFERELIRLLPAAPLKRPAGDEEARRLRASEEAEIREALTKAGLSKDVIVDRLKNYRRDQPPEELSQEFHLYAKGAAAYRQDNFGDAVAAWSELLNLPPEQRHFRTVWASYMIGRTLWSKDPVRARESLRNAREAAAQAFADSQELATASLGWEARTYLYSADYTSALKLYFRQFSCGDSSALASLQLTLRRVFQGSPYVAEPGVGDSDPLMQNVMPHPASEQDLARIADDKELRGVVTAWFAARGGPMLRWSTQTAAVQFGRWLKCLGSMKCLDPDEADRWCWVAYQNGLWEEAGKFVELAPANAPASEWVRAMLLLRGGKIEEAAAHMAGAARHFPEDASITGISYDPSIWEMTSGEWEQQPVRTEPVRHLGGLRGVLALNREKYTDALRLFLEAGHASDAAYVAEYVMTVDELLTFVREEKPARPVANESRYPWVAFDLQYLLARRLVRAGRFDEATVLFPDDLRSVYRRYVDDVRIGFDMKQAEKTRAESFWSAAQLIVKMGMELQGTELEPDYAICRGTYQWPATWSLRAGEGRGPYFSNYWNRKGRFEKTVPFGPSFDELERALKAKVPERRYHYRYRATELAWLAASLLPNDDELTATVLNTAGGWLAAKDPQNAALFYKTLVIRCPNTDLGKEAVARRWLVR